MSLPKYIQNSVPLLDFLSKSPATGLQVPYSVFSIFSCHTSITPASSTSSTVSLSLTLALHRFFTYFSMSKAFLSSKSDRSRYCLCLVMSNLLEKNGLTPLSCMIHFPPSITEISSIDINSLTHCQVKNSFLLLFHTRNLVDVL